MREVEPSLVEPERLEMEVVLERLSRSPQLVKLFSFICEKYFEGEADRLNEVRIATDVFDRPADFDRSQDAIARVEAHRLRKKLKEFYETDGKDHAVHISLPPGSYVPVFRHRKDATAESVGNRNGLPMNGSPLPDLSVQVDLPPSNGNLRGPALFDHRDSRERGRRWGLVLGVAIAVLIGGMVVWQKLYAYRGTAGVVGLLQNRAQASPAISTVAPESGPVRLLCGYSGQPHIGALGAVWGADQYYVGGRPEPCRTTFVDRANDFSLFQTERTGEFSYKVPLKPGTYELHLYFIETLYGAEMGGGELSRTFLVKLNGGDLLPAFDIISDAKGTRTADERVFRDVRPAADGKLHISLESERGQPILNAIEVLPGLPGRQLPIRLVAQANSYTDHAGQIWSPDNYYLGGQMSMRKPPVTGTSDPGLYACERIGNFDYAIPVDARDTYTVNLHFAETYFGPGASGYGGTGSRIFNVMCNGIMLLSNFDIYKEAGDLRAVTRSFHGLKPNAQGKLILSFEPVKNYASVFAIEVLDESK